MQANEDEALEEAAAWLAAQGGPPIRTSCAYVFLAGEVAWKIKRPVSLGFLDFSTLDRRRWAIERELSFNRLTAPDIYRRVRTITRAGQSLGFDGEGDVVEHVLEMRRFNERAVLHEQPQAVDGALAERLGREIARFHAKAPLRPEGGGTGALGYTIDSNADQLRQLAPMLGAEAVERLIAATGAAFEAAGPQLDARREEGFARRCHGDLHLGNILLEDGRPVLFDCIEFNDRLSEIDVQYDLAFLLMDLAFRGQRDAAARLQSAYLDEAARTFPDGLWSGLSQLPLMLSVRAAVRCHVTAREKARLHEAPLYLADAIDHLAPRPPVLAAVGGLSGTGKTTFARALAPLIGAAPGAVVLRSDEVRKRLWGAGPLERLPDAAYAAGVNAEVYGRMFAEAGMALAAGRAVVLDAVFLDPAARKAAEALAGRLGLPFEGVWLEAPPGELRARLESRTGDASDAGPAVLEEQLSRDPGAIAWTRLQAEGDFASAARTLASRLGD